MYFYEISQKAGIDAIALMGNQLGLGQRPDLPMSAITDGVMPNKAWKQKSYAKDWVIGDTINASIGQGYVLTSPLQLAIMTARIASGTAVNARLLHSIGNDPVPVEPAPQLDIAQKHLDSVRRGMFEVINGAHGSAKSSRIAADDMQMAGKTGTAQVRNISTAERESGVRSNDSLPWRQRDHALFVCYAPFDNPRYAVSVVVEHGGGGSTVAAPIARDVMLRCLTGGIPPLSAYPASQRGRIETQLKAMKLRETTPDDGVKSKA